MSKTPKQKNELSIIHKCQYCGKPSKYTIEYNSSVKEKEKFDMICGNCNYVTLIDATLTFTPPKTKKIKQKNNI